jgi:hypothetical protein
MLPLLSVSTVSQIWMPVIDAAPENGPKVIAVALVAEPAGEAAAPNDAVMC